MVIWDREDYIAEAINQLKDGSIYKIVKFKDKIPQDLAKKVMAFSKVLSRNVKLLKNS